MKATAFLNFLIAVFLAGPMSLGSVAEGQTQVDLGRNSKIQISELKSYLSEERHTGECKVDLDCAKFKGEPNVVCKE